MTVLPEGYVKVLDKGYVGLDDWMGDDKKAARAARVSFAKSADQYTDAQNDSLVKYLLNKDEYSPFRHSVLTFEIRMPLMVARQMYKYVVASNWTEDQLGWNENSRRYITDNNEFYIPGPDEWRKAPENKKQGSGELFSTEMGQLFTDQAESFYSQGDQLYRSMVESFGMAPEQARIFIPAYGLYVSSYWTASLPSVLHVVDERIDHGAQKEIQDYAKVIKEFTASKFPKTIEFWDEVRTKRY